MEPSQDTTPQRRKGQPPKPDVEPMHKKVLRCVIFWIPLTILVVFCSMFWLWAMHNIRLVVSGTRAVAQMAADRVDAEAAYSVAEEILQIREEAPRGATLDYTADEQVVLLGRYQAVEERSDWQELQRYFSEVSGRYAYAGEFALVAYDETASQLIWLAAPEHATGYTAWRKDLALPDETGYDVSAFAGHREGTAVLVPLPERNGEPGLYICGSFSFAGIMGEEAGKLLIPLILGGILTVIVCLRILWIYWKRKMQEMQEENEEAEDKAEDLENDVEEDVVE